LLLSTLLLLLLLFAAGFAADDVGMMTAPRLLLLPLAPGVVGVVADAA
jgi:hypothetical protein